MSLSATYQNATAGPGDEAQTAKLLLGANLHHQSARASCTSLSTFNDEDLTELDENCKIEEAIVMDAREISKHDITVTPPLPQRSALRSSRLLDSLKFRSIETAAQSITTPHDVYMSSEEDASSSADDFSGDDYDYDLYSEPESEGSGRSLASRKSHEDTARVVSVVFVGKPNVVELFGGRRSVSPLSAQKRSRTAGDFRVASGPPAFDVSTLPRRQSAMAATSSRKPKPAFLNTDPFAGHGYKHDSSQRDANDGYRPPTPKTPTAVLNRFQKSLRLARKRSQTNLKEASRDGLTKAASSSTLNLSLSTTNAPEPHGSADTQDPASNTPVTPPTPVTYQEIIRAARKNSISHLPLVRSETPSSPDGGKKGILSGLNANRRKSMRA